MPPENKSNRRLAAILFADIVGYTAMMQSDEGLAMSRHQRYQDVLKAEVKAHKGEIIKNYGDGSLCLFGSVLDAVNCAKIIQKTLQEEPKVPLRIGVHLGDVMYRDDDIYGNAVNVSSRIESMGVPGSVLMSKNVYDKVKNQSTFSFESYGSFEFKNVEEPMELFALANDGLVVPRKDELKGKLAGKASKKPKTIYQNIFPLIALLFLAFVIYYFMGQRNMPIPSDLDDKSIAVLPFTDLSPQKDQEYFSIGMMDEILNHLVKIEDLKVSSRTSSMQFLNSKIPINEISKSLGVNNVLEGSVRKAGDQIRITVQLINGITDKHLWSETYDREFKDIFSIQSDVAQRVAETLRAEIYSDVKERIETVPTRNMEAYDLWLRTYDMYPSALKADQLHEIIRQDPNFASAYALLANVWLNRGAFAGELSREEILPEAKKYLDKAFELDPNDAIAHKNKAQLTLWYEWDFEEAEKQWNIYVQLFPSNLNPNIIDFYSASGSFKEAKEWAERIYNAYPKEGVGWSRRGLPYALSGDFEKSDEFYNYVVDNHKFWYPQCEAARGFLYSGNYEKAIELINRAFVDNDNDLRYPRNLSVLAIANYKLGHNSKASDLLDELLTICESGTTGSPAFYTAMVYAQMGELDQAFRWLNQAFESHEIEMYWLKVEPPFSPLHNDPRWKEMLRNVGFNDNVKG